MKLKVFKCLILLTTIILSSNSKALASPATQADIEEGNARVAWYLGNLNRELSERNIPLINMDDIEKISSGAFTCTMLERGDSWNEIFDYQYSRIPSINRKYPGLTTSPVHSILQCSKHSRRKGILS